MGARAFRPPPRRRPGKTLLRVELMSIDEALFDPVFGLGALAALACAETGCMGERMADCAVCCRPWAPGRRPLRAMVVHTSNLEHGEVANVGFVCEACADGSEAEVWARVRARVRADVPDLHECAFVDEPGRA